jgi:hypothetical protein
MTMVVALAVLASLPGALAPQAPVRTVTFRPLDPAERAYVFRSDGSQEIWGERTRFQDGRATITYRFDFVKGTSTSLRMRITAQFQVDLSSDGKRFDTVAVYTKDKGEPLTLDLTPYTGPTGAVYVRVGDAKPDDGWGGKIHEVSVTGRLLDGRFKPIGDIPPHSCRTGRRSTRSCPGPSAASTSSSRRTPRCRRSSSSARSRGS